MKVQIRMLRPRDLEYASSKPLEGVVNVFDDKNDQIQSSSTDSVPNLHTENSNIIIKAHLLRELRADYQKALEENDTLGQANVKYEWEIKTLKDTMWNKGREITQLTELNQEYVARNKELEEEIESFVDGWEEEKRKRRKVKKKIRRLERRMEKLKTKVISQRLGRESQRLGMKSTQFGDGDVKTEKSESDNERKDEILPKIHPQPA